MEIKKAKDLRLGDVVEVSPGPFCTAIVQNVGTDFVEFFRPYGTTADFSYTGGVICYIGIEIFKVGKHDNHRDFTVVQGGKELK